MREEPRRSNGVFRPCEVEQMRRELKRGDRPGESPSEREQRAIAIIRRHSRKQPATQPIVAAPPAPRAQPAH